MKFIHFAAGAVLLLAASHSVQITAARSPSSSDHDAEEIRRSLAAAPSAIAARARVISEGPDGKMITLREGDNGWTCMPPGHGAGADPEPMPACFDANGLAFIEAFGAGHPPDPGRPGYSYMLQGGSAWSAVDPMATTAPPGHKPIHIPPHLMILSAPIANGSGLPLHDADPDTSKPFVLFGGTPYAILILPVE